MASSQAVKTLNLYKKYNQIERGLGANLPAAYKKFYNEWKLTEPTAVHYLPEDGKWKLDEVTNQVLPIQNIPIPLKFPTEYHDQLWGGEGIVQGFEQKKERVRRNPHFWIPSLQRSVVYSEVLNKHIAVVISKHAITMIHSNYGFDHYLLKTPANDLKSLLATGLKRKILQDLENGCPAYKAEPDKQKDILSRYGQYLESYTPEEIEWYGYSLKDALKKYKALLETQKKIVPLKEIYRAELLGKLKAVKLADNENIETKTLSSGSSAWLSKINPFSKKHET